MSQDISMALASPPIQWQIDIMGLTKMFLGAGAQGLKQIALAGVDPHTVGSILILGELAPISLDFRKRLNACREKQKKSRKIIYKAIEIGTATNFIADELLKRRPGENVLALLTAIISVLTDNSYTDAMTTLYSMSRIDGESTPGIGQLQRLRAALLPFINEMDIKNKVLQYHVYFCQFTSADHAPYQGIPDAGTMSRMIHIFHKLATSNEEYRLMYWGVKGAGWVAAYARDILGLSTCLLINTPSGKTCVPMSAEYDEAKVIFCPDSDADMPELRKAGKVDELIQRNSISETGIEWTIDCDTVSYFETHHPQLNCSPFHTKVSEVVAAKTLDCVTELTHDLSYSVNLNQPHLPLPLGLISYQMSVLVSVHKRALLILQVLGFMPPPLEVFQFDSAGYTQGLETDDNEEDRSCPDYWMLKRDIQTDKWWPNDLDKEFEGLLDYWLTRLQPEHSRSHFSNKPHRSSSASRILSTTKNAVLFASYMAFTDWHLSLRRMSVEFFSLAVLMHGGSKGNINEGNGMRKIQRFCTAHPSPEPLFWALGQELNGIVLLRQVPLAQTIHGLDGILICFHPGHILFEGERCAEIHVSDVKDAGKPYELYPPMPSFKPSIIDVSIEISSSCRLAGGNVYISTEALQQGSITKSTISDRALRQVVPIHPELIAENLTRLLVTNGCLHEYGEKLPDKLIKQCIWKEGLTLGIPFADSHRKLSIGELDVTSPPKATGTNSSKRIHVVYYQAVDGHGLGQWLACHLSLSSRSIVILQSTSCLECTLNRAIELKSMYDGLEDEDICIIAGREPGVDPSLQMDEVTLVGSH